MKFKTTLTLVFILFTSLMFAQYPKTTSVSDRVESNAEQLTTKYSNELALNGVQIPLFREVVKDYLLKSETIKDKFEGREQLDKLVELQAEETLKMQDILTQPQYRLYKKLKVTMQPLKVLK